MEPPHLPTEKSAACCAQTSGTGLSQEDVEHHVKEEEGEMFPDAKKFLGAEKLQSLGERIARRKEEVESN
jgi:hypothetical protein